MGLEHGVGGEMLSVKSITLTVYQMSGSIPVTFSVNGGLHEIDIIKFSEILGLKLFTASSTPTYEVQLFILVLLWYMGISDSEGCSWHSSVQYIPELPL